MYIFNERRTASRARFRLAVFLAQREGKIHHSCKLFGHKKSMYCKTRNTESPGEVIVNISKFYIPTSLFVYTLHILRGNIFKKCLFSEIREPNICKGTILRISCAQLIIFHGWKYTKEVMFCLAGDFFFKTVAFNRKKCYFT